jgi:hypothetical protein
LNPILLNTSTANGTALVSADFWCLGYLRGITLREEAWKPLARPNNDAGLFLETILALAMPLLTPESDDD